MGGESGLALAILVGLAIPEVVVGQPELKKKKKTSVLLFGLGGGSTKSPVNRPLFSLVLARNLSAFFTGDVWISPPGFPHLGKGVHPRSYETSCIRNIHPWNPPSLPKANQHPCKTSTNPLQRRPQQQYGGPSPYVPSSSSPYSDDGHVDPDNTNVFVGNLPKAGGQVTVQDLREAFVSAGSKVADIVEVKGSRQQHILTVLITNTIIYWYYIEFLTSTLELRSFHL